MGFLLSGFPVPNAHFSDPPDRTNSNTTIYGKPTAHLLKTSGLSEKNRENIYFEEYGAFNLKFEVLTYEMGNIKSTKMNCLYLLK